MKTHEGRALLTAKQAGRYLNLNAAELRRLLRDGNLLGFKVGRVWRIPVVDCDEWIDAQREQWALEGDNGVEPDDFDEVEPADRTIVAIRERFAKQQKGRTG